MRYWSHDSIQDSAWIGVTVVVVVGGGGGSIGFQRLMKEGGYQEGDFVGCVVVGILAHEMI